jgi:hypothetical protein
MLQDLTNPAYSIHIICTNSDEAKAYIRTTVLDLLNLDTADTLEISTKQEFEQALSETAVPPFFSSEWLCFVNYNSYLFYTLTSSVRAMTMGFGTYIIFTENFQDYKKLREALPKNTVNCSYLMRLDDRDFNFILGKSATKLSQKLYKQVRSGYKSNIEALFTLKSALDSGVKFGTSKQIEDMCGAPDFDAINFILNLCNYAQKTSQSDILSESKWNKKIKNTIRKSTSTLLAASQLKSPRYCQVTLQNTAMNCLTCKREYLNGNLYLPSDASEWEDTYLRKTAQKIAKISPIGVDYFLFVIEKLNSSIWHTEEDIVEFVYDYYTSLSCKISHH